MHSELFTELKIRISSQIKFFIIKFLSFRLPNQISNLDNFFYIIDSELLTELFEKISGINSQFESFCRIYDESDNKLIQIGHILDCFEIICESLDKNIYITDESSYIYKSSVEDIIALKELAKSYLCTISEAEKLIWKKLFNDIIESLDIIINIINRSDID